MRRRRRRDYTPAQKEATEALHRAEMWLNVVATGIADALKREHYCADGMRTVIGFVNEELEDAITDLEGASAEHDEAFQRNHPGPPARLVRVTRKTNPPRVGKSKPSTKQKAKNKGVQ
jgi:hypothetical protein